MNFVIDDFLVNYDVCPILFYVPDSLPYALSIQFDFMKHRKTIQYSQECNQNTRKVIHHKLY